MAQALFRLIAAGYRVVGFIHDEVLVELPVNANHTAEAKKICQIMREAMQQVTRGVPVDCEVALMDRWSKSAQAVYDAEKRLIVWKPGT